MTTKEAISPRDAISSRNDCLVALHDRLVDLKGTGWARVWREFEESRPGPERTIVPTDTHPCLVEAIAIQDRAIEEASRVLGTMTHRDWREKATRVAGLVEAARIDAGDRIRAAHPDGPMPRF